MNDPAFLFYSSDFLTGTMLFTDEQVGRYIRTLCYIHQHGHISIEELRLLCKEDNLVMNKFIKDSENKYYNNRLEMEINKRKLYSDSRRNNRVKKDMNKICKTYDEHMENENINNNIYFNNIILNNKYNEYLKMRIEKKCKATKTTIQSQIKRLSNKSEKEVLDILQYSIDNGYQGLFENKIKSEQDIRPNWYGKEVKKESMTKEEEQELRKELEEFN